MHFRHILMIALCCAVAHVQSSVPTVSTVGSTSTVPTVSTVGSTSTVPTVSTIGSNVGSSIVPISSPSLQSASASMMSASLSNTVPSVPGSLSSAAPSLSDVLPASTLSESSAPDSFPASVSQSSYVSESSVPAVPAPPVSEGLQEARIVTSLSASSRSFLRPAVVPPPPQQTAAQAAAAETDTDPQVLQLKNQLQVTIDNIATKKKEIEAEKAKIEQDTQQIREQNSNAERLKLLIVKQQKTAIKQKLEIKLRTIVAQLDAVKQQAHGVLGQKSALEETKAQIEQQIGRYV